MEPVELPLYQGVGTEGILVYVLGVTYSRILVRHVVTGGSLGRTLSGCVSEIRS